MRYAYQAYKGTQLIEFAGFVGRIRRSRRIRHNRRTLYCLFYRLLVNNNAAINVQTPISPAQSGDILVIAKLLSMYKHKA